MILSLMEKCINKCVVVLWENASVQILHPYNYVAECEEAALSKCSKSPVLYLRYMDDILIIWPHSKEEFWNFFDILNQQDDNIKL